MKNIALRFFGIAAFLAFGCLANTVKAQETGNTIQEVQLISNDDFLELKNLIAQNFDFTDPDLTEGVTQSVVKFEISQSGRLKNIHADGNCKYVSKNLENAMNGLQYKFKANKKRPFTYVMPVEVSIASR
ncbi:hypothetical protein [Chryseobacterium sp.]|uniref:hypothetical protein n=1 Tax=Chryseobacterium sp. TaxID=1871047 RepID=UPI0011C95ED5|nr:hypothetical protein [Chryseobacterium sp.]TXF78963.1 hypothetical protein FUA25_00800 [Chryseobacterium sp.]